VEMVGGSLRFGMEVIGESLWFGVEVAWVLLWFGLRALCDSSFEIVDI